MANTIRAARNTFSGGLVMDLTPDNTSEKVLSSALNATFVTFNGNELSLQNDMGNGRVETARLPEGYIPVGTCEFGDIIYIVSYNPLTNKSLIGCFPSPERNISSEEIGNTGQLLAASDFLVLKQVNNKYIPTGELITSSVKKIIYNNKMNPGDKYIIYDKNNQICSQKYLTDLGNTHHTYGSFPKLYRIHVIAIEDSGKINFLDSTVRWYDGNDYFIMPTKENNSNNIPDIDSYRDLLSSGYSVFQSKISGKLGLLIELEKINGFSCTYNVYTSKGETLLTNNTENTDSTENTDNTNNDGIYTKDCKVYWSINWNTTDNNINPAYLVLTKSEWINKEIGVEGGQWFSWKYDFNTNKIAPNKKEPIFNIPKAFGQDDYWYRSIGRLYNPTSVTSYESFLNDESYDVGLNEFITDTKKYNYEITTENPTTGEPTIIKIFPYRDTDLVKINSVKQYDDDNFIGIPIEGKYYINLSAIEKTENGYLAYTDCITEQYMRAKIDPKEISDDVVNNYFNTSISKYFADFKVPVKQLLTINGEEHEYTPNISNLIYHYEITPAMDYGLLREYSIEGYIDFSKIGTGSIDLTYWKYYNTQNTSTLSVGFDAYVEENKGIAEVVLEFYDNQGIAAAYHIRNKESYSGTFTEFIPLNGAATSSNLTSTDSDDKPIYHLGTKTTKLAENVIYMNDDKKPKPLYYMNGDAYEDLGFNKKHDAINDLYINDAGTIYSNALYLVKIIVKYCLKDALGNLDTSVDTEFKTYYRWFWTNTMYNLYYSNINDFNTLPFLLNLDVRAVYSPSENYHYQSITYSSPHLRSKTTNSSELYKNSAATIQVVTSDNDSNKNNTLYYLQAGLSNTYNTFNLRGEADDNSGVYSGVYNAMSIDIFTDCDQYVLNVVEDPDIVHAGQSNYSEWTGIKPIVAKSTEKTKIGKGLRDVLKTTKLPINSFYSGEDGEDIWDSTNGYKDQINNFQVTNFGSEQLYDKKQKYIAYNNTAKSLNGKHYITKTLKDIYSINKLGTFEADIIHFSKYYYTNIEENLTAPCLVPLLRNIEDLETYGLAIKSKENSEENTEENTGENIPYVKFLYTFNMYDDGDGTESHLDIRKHSYASATSKPEETGAWGDDWDDSENQSVFGHSDGYFFRDKRSEWFSFKTQGFFLWGLSAAYDSKYAALCNFDPRNRASGDDARGYHDPIGGKWKTLYGPGEINSYATTDEDRKRAHSWNDSDGRQIAAIGFNPGGDKLEHYFNTMFLIEKMTGQEVQFKSPYKERYPRYIGQYIATILCGIYLYSTDEALRVLKTNDIVHMDNNYTIYTKDIVYIAKIKQGFDHNELISLHDIHFDDYIKCVKENSGVINNSNVKLNDNNVTLTILGCVKNNPIQYKLEYITPKYDNLAFEGFTTAMVVKADGTRVPAQSANFEKDKLYWLDENNTVLKLSRKFSAECVQNIYDDLGELRVTYNQAWGRMEFPNIYKMFKWEEEKLALSYTDMAPSGEDRFSIHGQEEEDFAIRDMRKDEILVPLGNMMRPENIPI